MLARIFALFTVALVTVSAPAWSQPADTGEPADPPDRVGRLSVVEGTVQQRSADDQQWAPASANYPVTDGFAVATQNGRAEIEVGSLALRVGANSEVDVNTLTDTAAVVTLAQGELNLRLGHLSSEGHIQVVTPRGVVDVVAAGQYHFDAGTTDAPTAAGVFKGKAQIERDNGAIDVKPGQVVLISGDASSGAQISTAQLGTDDLDTWALSRDYQAQHPPSAAAAAPPPPLSPDMTGAAELTDYGTWSSDPDYGAVWYPASVPAGWAPYAYGHWAWVSPWGWTWIDDQPWGFAPFHYGRWAYRPRGWCWVPGVAVAHPVYAPALVAFIGSPGGSLFIGAGIAGVAWFPLAPHEVFVPAYRTSVAYVRNVNATSVNVTNIHITRVNNRVVVNSSSGSVVSSFANRRFATAVPNSAFGSARPVHQAAVAVPASLTSGSQPVTHAPDVAAPPHAARPQPATPSRGTQSQSTSVSRTSNPVHMFPTLPPGRSGAPAPTNASVNPTPQTRRAPQALPTLPPSHGNAVVNRTPGNAPAATPHATPQQTRPLGTQKPATTPQGAAPSRSRVPASATAAPPHGSQNGAPTNRQLHGTAAPANQPPHGNAPSVNRNAATTNGGHNGPTQPQPHQANRSAPQGAPHDQGHAGPPPNHNGQPQPRGGQGQGSEKDQNKPQQ